MRALAVLSLGATVLFGTARARAEEPPLFEPGDRTTSHVSEQMKHDATRDGDGVYGRFDGLFDLGLHAGPEVMEHGTGGFALATLHYLFMAGIYASYADSLGDDALPTRRRIAFGVDMRPAFIPRWSRGLQDGPSFIDLAVDSISLSLGAYFRERRGHSFGADRGLDLSLGFGVPVAGAAEGPWLGARGALRWDDPTRRRERAEAALELTFGWHFTLGH